MICMCVSQSFKRSGSTGTVTQEAERRASPWLTQLLARKPFKVVATVAGFPSSRKTRLRTGWLGWEDSNSLKRQHGTVFSRSGLCDQVCCPGDSPVPSCNMALRRITPSSGSTALSSADLVCVTRCVAQGTARCQVVIWRYVVPHVRNGRSSNHRYRVRDRMWRVVIQAPIAPNR